MGNPPFRGSPLKVLVFTALAPFHISDPAIINLLEASATADDEGLGVMPSDVDRGVLSIEYFVIRSIDWDSDIVNDSHLVYDIDSGFHVFNWVIQGSSFLELV